MTLYGIEIPRAPRMDDGWAENVSIHHLKAYARIRKMCLVPVKIWNESGDEYRIVHAWEEDT